MRSGGHAAQGLTARLNRPPRSFTEGKTMRTAIQRAPAATIGAPWSSPGLRNLLHAWHAIVRRVDAWSAARARVAADREILANMSDRELLDIGIERGIAHTVAEGRWTRDAWP